MFKYFIIVLALTGCVKKEPEIEFKHSIAYTNGTLSGVVTSTCFEKRSQYGCSVDVLRSKTIGLHYCNLNKELYINKMKQEGFTCSIYIDGKEY